MKQFLRTVVAYTTLFMLGVVGLAPFAYMLLLSTKRRIEIVAQVPPELSFNFETIVKNYNEVLFSLGMASFILNSLLVVGLSTLIALLLATPAAYAFSRLRFRSNHGLANWILSLRFMPPIAIAVPLFLMMRYGGIEDSYLGLVLPYVSFSLPVIIWILIGFFDEVPSEIDDAALIDGCSRFEVLWRVLLPLVRPGLATASLFSAIFIWNEFLLALYVIDSHELQTIALGAATLVSAQRPIDWHIAAGVGVTTVVPILVFSVFVQKYLVRGLTAGAVK